MKAGKTVKYSSSTLYSMCNVLKYKLLLCIFCLIVVLSSTSGCGSSGGGDASSSSPSTNIVVGTNPTTLSWEPPLGQPADMTGYRVYYGTGTRNYLGVVNAGSSTSAVIDSLPSGVWYFAVTSYDSAGNESTYSNEVAKQIL